MRKVDSEAQRMHEEAENLAQTTMKGLGLDELIDFNGYKERVKKDYELQERKYNDRLSDENVPVPRYRKLESEDVQDKSWWPKVQPLFKDGATIDNIVFHHVENYLQKQQRQNPII